MQTEQCHSESTVDGDAEYKYWGLSTTRSWIKHELSHGWSEATTNMEFQITVNKVLECRDKVHFFIAAIIVFIIPF